MIWYYYLYYRLYNFARAISDDAINEWKPLVLIFAMLAGIVMQGFIWFYVVTKNPAELPMQLLFAFTLLVFVVNYFVFIDKSRWKIYAAEFATYSKQKNVICGVVILLTAIVIFAGLVLAYHEYSKINWILIEYEKYRERR